MRKINILFLGLLFNIITVIDLQAEPLACPVFTELTRDTYMRQNATIDYAHRRWKVHLFGSMRPILISKETKPKYTAAAIHHMSKMPFCLGLIDDRKFSLILKSYSRKPPKCKKDADEIIKFDCDFDAMDKRMAKTF